MPCSTPPPVIFGTAIGRRQPSIGTGTGGRSTSGELPGGSGGEGCMVTLGDVLATAEDDEAVKVGAGRDGTALQLLLVDVPTGTAGWPGPSSPHSAAPDVVDDSTV